MFVFTIKSLSLGGAEGWGGGGGRKKKKKSLSLKKCQFPRPIARGNINMYSPFVPLYIKKGDNNYY